MSKTLTKIIELSELAEYDEPRVQLVRPHEFNVKLARIKTAGEAMDYIKNVKPIPGKTIILVLAMTAGEFYGANRNGDAWPERPLRVGTTDITADDVLPKHYHTFETNANVYRHHINKDPAKSIGQVQKAFYNWPMHRVELLLALDNKLAEDAVQEIESGKFPAVSMGCRVKYDVCSICGNCAPSRKEYCEHAKYQLGELLSNGKRIFVWNPSPKFFDISIVRRPADKLGYMMKKVAEAVPEIYSSADLGDYAEGVSRKIANLRKLSLIHKVLRGTIGATKNDSGEVREIKNFVNHVATPAAKQMPPIPDETIKQLVRYRPAEVLATLSSMGILLTTPEFIKYFVWRIDPDMDISEEELDRAVAVQQHVFELLASNPKILEEIDELGYLNSDPSNIRDELVKKVQPLVEKRSQAQDWILHRMIKVGYTPGDFDLVDVIDPVTGNQYLTTVGAIRRSRGGVQKRYRYNILGGAGLLAGGLAMMAVPGLRHAAPLLLNPGAKRMMSPEEPQSVMTPHGKVYGPGQTPGFRGFRGTELVEKQSEAPEPDMANATIRLAMDLQHRPRARGRKIAMRINEDELSFEQAAEKLGELICP